MVLLENVFKGFSAVVSGGSSGLGLATVHRLAKLGFSVAICDINEPREPTSENCYFIKTDVTNDNDVIKAMEVIEKRTNKLDMLVNCAGIAMVMKVFNAEYGVMHPLAPFEESLKVNTIGTFNMIRNCCSLFSRNEENESKQRGVIVNTSSLAAFEGQRGQGAYAASSGAVVSMTLPLARELADIGVRVVTIAPGIFFTPPLESLSDYVLRDLNNLVPFPRRLGHSDEFAHLVQFIFENKIMNGAVIRLDGAIRMWP